MSLDGIILVDVSIRFDLEAMQRMLSEEQITALMNGVAEVLNAGKAKELARTAEVEAP